MLFKTLSLTLILVVSSLRCAPKPTDLETSTSTKEGLTIESSCFNKNKKFLAHYFSGKKVKTKELENFFDCLDNLIQALLNHTQTENPQYYTQTELRRFIQYMGGTKTEKTEKTARDKAEKMSQALLQLKVGFIGGMPNRLTLNEITLCRKILYVFRNRMSVLSPSMPLIIQILREPQTKGLVQAMTGVKTHAEGLAEDLSELSFSSDLSLLAKLPDRIQTLTGISHKNLKYWEPSILILQQWQKIFGSSKQIIKSVELSPLLDSLGELFALWLYHNRFLTGHFYLHPSVVQNTQYFLSRSLKVLEQAFKSSGKKHIVLSDMDELARRVWFLPSLSRPLFRLGLRSVSCFLLKPLAKNKACGYETHFKEQTVTVRFSDLTFTVTDKKNIQESSSGGPEEHIDFDELSLPRKYLDSWSQAEKQIRTSGSLPPLFGSPSQWLNRKIALTPYGSLSFQGERKNHVSFLSQLNWQSHLMQVMTRAYTHRGHQEVNQQLWNTMIKEWTALSIVLYKPLKWEQFQKAGFQVFRHGDFMTSQSNGDGVLQEEELLELFALSVSSATLLLSSLPLTTTCEGAPPYHLPVDCMWALLENMPTELFAGFPVLAQSLLAHEDKKASYMGALKSVYNQEDFIPYKDLFKIFLFIHYQENMLEHLDIDRSFDLNAKELAKLLPIFERTIIEDVPLFNNKREAFAFITYLFYYGEIPVFNDNSPVSAPLRFSNWLLHPEKWQIKADHKDILKAVLLVNQAGESINL